MSHSAMKSHFVCAALCCERLNHDQSHAVAAVGHKECNGDK